MTCNVFCSCSSCIITTTLIVATKDNLLPSSTSNAVESINCNKRATERLQTLYVFLEETVQTVWCKKQIPHLDNFESLMTVSNHSREHETFSEIATNTWIVSRYYPCRGSLISFFSKQPRRHFYMCEISFNDCNFSCAKFHVTLPGTLW